MATPASSRGTQQHVDSFKRQYALNNNSKRTRGKGSLWDAFEGLDQVAGDVATWLRRHSPGLHAEEKPHSRAQALPKLIRAIFTAAPDLKKALQRHLQGLAIRVNQRLGAATAEHGCGRSAAAAKRT